MQSPRGTKDTLPEKSKAWRIVEAKMAETARLFGYGEIRTPIFEQTEVFSRVIGEETDVVGKEMYTFPDRGNKSMTLRPEFTAGVIRAAAQHNLLAQHPIQRLWYAGPLFRYERPQEGRFRQFHQFGAECIGADSPESDVEIITLAHECLVSVGITDAKLQLNTLGNKESRLIYREKLVEFLHSVADSLSEDSRRRIERNPLRVLDSKDAADRAALANAPALADYLDNESKEHFGRVTSLLNANDITFEIHPRLVRGLDYYSHTVFEFVGSALGAQDALGGGGRFNDMFEYFGAKHTPAVGFSIGLERVLVTLEQHNEALYSSEVPTVSIIALGGQATLAAGNYARTLRSAGFSVITDVMGRSMKSLMKEADKLKIPIAVIIGDNELANGTVVIRNMLHGGQWECPVSEISGTIAGILA